MGLCEPCYNNLCKQNARIETPQMDTTTWNAIASTLFRPVSQVRKRRN